MIFTACDKGDFGDNGNPSEGGVILDPNNPLNNHKCASNEILYVSKSCLPMELNNYGGWGANLTSNTYDNGVGRLKFDRNVTTIPRGAFEENELLRYIKMPNTITEIGYGSFYKCSSLTSVTIPDSVTSIGSYAFVDCSSLTSVTIPDSVTWIGDSAFYDCSSLISIHISDLSAWCKIDFDSASSNPLRYGAKLYLNGSELTNITIPSDITEIKDCAFYGCSSLTSVTIGNSVTEIGDWAFYGCRGELIINSKIVGTNYTDGNSPINSWLYGSKFTKLTIGNSVTSIGEYAFYGCSSLTSVTIPDSVTSIGECAFYGCSSLTSITIPDSVTSIDDSAFRNCSNLTAFYGKFASSDNRCLIVDGVLHSFAPAGLTEYTIPDSVTSIGNFAFEYCSSLTSVTIPDSVTSIGYRAFYNCTALKEVYCMPIVPPSIDSYAFDDNATTRVIYVPVNSVSSYQTKWWRYKHAITYEGGPLRLKVGDFVSKNGATGIVFYTNDSTIKIVSVAQTSKYHWDDAKTWCSNVGSNWYLPSTSTLEEIYWNISTINSTLSANGYTTIYTGYYDYYWSSTEGVNKDYYAYVFSFRNAESNSNYKYADTAYSVRAVLDF